MGSLRDRLLRWAEDPRDKTEFDAWKLRAEVAAWPTWPQRPEGARRYIIGVVGVAAVLLAITWGVAFSQTADGAACNGKPMATDAVCEYWDGGKLLYSKTYSEMLESPDHSTAWVFTALVAGFAVLFLWSRVSEMVRGRRPTVAEVEQFMDRYRAAGAEIAAKLQRNPTSNAARQLLAGLEAAGAEVAARNGFKIIGDVAVIDIAGGR